MPRWKALPDELDPQVKEFAGQLRGLVDRSGLSIAAVSDRTGYSKTSWERYLNGRLLAPKGAIVALAEVTGTPPVHLITLWELAERAWSRSEMRHDMTMQAIRISQARAALGESGGSGESGESGTEGGGGAGSTGGARRARRDSGVGPATGVAGPAGVSPVAAPGVFGAPGSGGSAGAGPGGAGVGGGSSDGQRRRRKVTMFLVGVVGALVVIAAAVFMTGFGGDDKDKKDDAKPSVTPSSSDTKVPAGGDCEGAECAGKDPEKMGCGGDLATTASRATVGKAVIEVRYSAACGAAWARITQAAVGDKVTITGSGSGAGAKQDGTVNADFDAYTPMVAASSGAVAKACAVLGSGQSGCTGS
ncbi:XRE family transcriptional regulator [Streptomyces sp. NPDC005562]|uniref:XRE family transcriptional regulator n=1 Tax=Streptomyces sp. NPDC005562 TaxID=3154890 RepID=UPI0033A7430B